MLTVVLVAHVRALEGSFFWDDTSLIVENPLVQDGSTLRGWFSEPFWDAGPLREEPRGLYRPLTLISYRLDHLIHADNPAGFHATNLLLHGLGALLLYLVARRFGASSPASALAAGCWGVLPRLTECTAWISGRTDVLATLLVAAALLLWPWSNLPVGSPRRFVSGWALSCAALFLALLSKEVAIAAVLAIAAAELFHVRSSSLRLVSLKLLPVALGALLYLFLRFTALGTAQTPGMYAGIGTRMVRMLGASGSYAVMLVDAFRPNAQIGLLDRIPAWQIAFGIPVALGVCLAVGWALHRRLAAHLLAVLLFGVLSLFAVLHILPLPTTVIASDRFLYAPTAAIAILGAVGASRLSGRRLRVAVAACLAFIVAGCWGTWRRIGVWNDPLVFWIDAAERAHEDNYLPVGSLALALQSEGYFVEAEALQRAALDAMARIEASPTSSLFRIGRGNVAEALTARGEYAQAAATWRTVLRDAPDLGFGWLRLGRLEAWQGNWAAARECTDRAMRSSPTDPRVVRQSELLPVWQDLASRMPDESRAERDDKAALDRVRSLTLLRMIPEASRAWRALIPRTGEPAVLVEGMRFFAEDAPARDALWALGMMDALQLRGEEAEALRVILMRRAASANRVEELLPRIQTMIVAAERRRAVAASSAGPGTR